MAIPLARYSFLFIIFFNTYATDDNSSSTNGLGRRVLDDFPLIDGHNDLPFNLFRILNNQLQEFHFDTNLTSDPKFGLETCDTCHTDLPRLRKGKVGAQFWVAYTRCEAIQYKDAVVRTLDQIDVIKRLIRKYPDHLELATTPNGILDIFKRGKIASLIGVEGGHSINYKLSILRMFHDLGVRYMTLTHKCNLPWADSSLVDANRSVTNNLTDFGKKVVLEMNRLGMLVDLSHVSYHVMNEAISVSKAPVMFSHSSAYAIFAHHRNVQDDVLHAITKNRGIIMVNFFPIYISAGPATIDNVIEHINHIVDVAGIDYVGIGSDFDGVKRVPTGLEDVSKFPDLFDRLKILNRTRWTDENLEKLAGKNFIRVFRAVETIREELKDKIPDESIIPDEDLKLFEDISKCIS